MGPHPGPRPTFFGEKSLAISEKITKYENIQNLPNMTSSGLK